MFKHWSASNIIAFVAVVSPAFTLFMQYLMSKHHDNAETNQIKLKLESDKFHEHLTCIQNDFLRYANYTISILSASQLCLDKHRYRELKLPVLLFADNQLTNDIKRFEKISRKYGLVKPKQDAFEKVIISYRQQIQSEKQKDPSKTI